MTQTAEHSSSSVTSPLDRLAEQIVTQYRNEQKIKQQSQQHYQRRLHTQAITVLQTLLDTELDPSVLSQLVQRYETRDCSETATAEAVFDYAGLQWHLCQDFAGRFCEQWHWSITAYTTAGGYQRREDDLSITAKPGTLQTALLLKIGMRLEQLHKLRQEAEEREAREQQRIIILAQAEEQRAIERKEEERQQATRIAAANEEDARWHAALEDLKQQAMASMWQWPQGVSIMIYRVTYIVAIGSDESGDAIIERESGWCGTDVLDERGYVRLESTTSSWAGESAERDIKLDMAIHRPVWQRFTISSIDDLERELREECTVSIPQVVLRYDEELGDGKQRLVKVERYWYEEEAHRIHVGFEPLPWVRALVEQAATAKGDAVLADQQQGTGSC